MTPLAQILIDQIRATGPMSVADYMSACLLHPEHGYYTQQQVFGQKGDFVTAPEVSQMFGELIGLALAQAWLTQGSRSDAILVELGPGQGTLMQDMLRATRRVPGFADLPVHMVEGSPRLRARQTQAVPGVIHHNDVSTLPQAPQFLIANEFFDALPIRQFRRTSNGWSETLVGNQNGSLTFGQAKPSQIDALSHREDTTSQDDLIEICPSLPPIVEDIGRTIAEQGGAALLIDYGHWQGTGTTLQSVKNHQPIGTLEAPGTADITAHVDFAAIAAAATPAVASAMTTQGMFLERLGITHRAQILAKQLTGPDLEAHIAAHRRLTHPDEMGDLFKVIGLARTADHLPPGLDH